MVDLTTVEGVQNYLSQTPFAASSVVSLSGGFANFTYRIRLQEPYIHVASEDPVHSLVLKHAEPYVAVNRNFPLSAERQEFESLAFKLIPQLISPVPAISIPQLYYEDVEQRVVMMSDSGDACITLKALFQTTPPTDGVSRIVGYSLGAFLARLHNSTSYAGFPGSEVKTAFAANQMARVVSGHVTYGRLVDTLFPTDKGNILIDPPLNISATEIETVAILARTMQERIMSNEDVLTMGDFWPGNLLVSLIPEPHVTVVDWELAKPGLAGLDIGQFLAEMFLLRVFHPSCRTAVNFTITSFLTAYRDAVLKDNVTEKNLMDVAWVAATHMGAHLITWTPRIPWGSKEQTRAVVMDGLEHILRVSEGNEVWLRNSWLGTMLP